MHDSMLHKLEKLRERLIEIQDTLVDSDTVKDIEKYTQLNKEFSDLKPIVEKFEEYNETITRIQGANSILESEDDELKEEQIYKERKKYIQFAVVMALVGLTIYSYGK